LQTLQNRFLFCSKLEHALRVCHADDMPPLPSPAEFPYLCSDLVAWEKLGSSYEVIRVFAVVTRLCRDMTDDMQTPAGWTGWHQMVTALWTGGRTPLLSKLADIGRASGPWEMNVRLLRELGTPRMVAVAGSSPEMGLGRAYSRRIDLESGWRRLGYSPVDEVTGPVMEVIRELQELEWDLIKDSTYTALHDMSWNAIDTLWHRYSDQYAGAWIQVSRTTKRQPVPAVDPLQRRRIIRLD